MFTIPNYRYKAIFYVREKSSVRLFCSVGGLGVRMLRSCVNDGLEGGGGRDDGGEWF